MKAQLKSYTITSPLKCYTITPYPIAKLAQYTPRLCYPGSATLGRALYIIMSARLLGLAYPKSNIYKPLILLVF